MVYPCHLVAGCMAPMCFGRLRRPLRGREGRNVLWQAPARAATSGRAQRALAGSGARCEVGRGGVPGAGAGQLCVNEAVHIQYTAEISQLLHAG